MIQVEFQGVGKTFQTGNQEIVALDDICLQVRQGEFWTIIGPSGSGKTTLLRCLAGFEFLTAGKIYVSGHQVSAPGRDRMMVFQDLDQLFPWRTVLSNVMLALKLAQPGTTPAERKSLALDYLDLMGLIEYAHFYPYQLSGGMKQRVAIARALGVKPSVLLMDEPFGSLDAITRSGLQKELLRIWHETGVTIIFVTHNIEEALLLADQIVVLARGGTIRAVVKNVLARPRSTKNASFTTAWQHLHHLLEQSGYRGQPGTASRPSLDPRPLARPLGQATL
ncbi:MAG: ABC transporter ATP-binding protein [Firmicutes bacterium]|nr:ABC transporter ATP-binding protein [Bacillota bacterium]